MDSNASYKSQLGEIQRKIQMNLNMFRIPDKPPWLRPYDPLSIIYNDFDDLKRFGRVTFGVIVQANNQLFEPGNVDYPAAILFSDNPKAEEDPGMLAAMADYIYEYKSKAFWNIPRYLRPVVRSMKNGRDRKSYEVNFTEHGLYPFDVHVSALLVFREHLAGGYIASRLYPVIYLPNRPEIVMIVPQIFL